MRRSYQFSSASESLDRSGARGVARDAAVPTPGKRWLFAFGLALLVSGCSGRGSEAVKISPKAAAEQALAEFDANKDGALDAKELEACPGLLSGMKRTDTDGDGRLTADEIAGRLTFFQEQGMQSDVAAEVLFNGQPLVGATITLVPESFMGPSVKPASTVTDESGAGFFKIEGSEYVQVAFGYYRVQVSRNAQGRETVPAKYNAKTILGHEVAPDVEGRGSSSTVRLRLTSR